MQQPSVYLDEPDIARLKPLAERERRSQAKLIREAIRLYAEQERPGREPALAGVARGPGGSIADLTQEDMLEGFGE